MNIKSKAKVAPEIVKIYLSDDALTVNELARRLNVSHSAANSYVQKLIKQHKVKRSEVRQGARGPCAIAYKVR